MNRLAAPSLDGFTRRRYHYWTGVSGQSYLHSVFAPAEQPHFTNSALVMIACDAGRRSIVDVAATGELPELYFNGGNFARTLSCGVNEVHVHFAEDAAAAQRAAADIAAGIARGQEQHSHDTRLEAEPA